MLKFYILLFKAISNLINNIWDFFPRVRFQWFQYSNFTVSLHMYKVFSSGCQKVLQADLIYAFFSPQNFLNSLQKGILKDKSWLEMLALVSKGLSPSSNIIGEYCKHYDESLSCWIIFTFSLVFKMKWFEKPDFTWVLRNMACCQMGWKEELPYNWT